MNQRAFKIQDTFRRVVFEDKNGGLREKLISIPNFPLLKDAGPSGETQLNSPSGCKIILRFSEDNTFALIQNVVGQDENGAPEKISDDLSVQFANEVEKIYSDQSISTVEASNRDRGIYGNW